jgi:hypothetical protein
MGLYRHRFHVYRPTEELSHYTIPLTSSSFDFITFLSLNGFCAFGEHELLALADMKNLGVLEVIQPADELLADNFPRISDRLVKGWSLKDDPFPVLRVLRIWGDEVTTRESLQFVSRFPSLVVYDVVGSLSDWKSASMAGENYGWRVGKPTGKIEGDLLLYISLLTRGDPRFPQKVTDVARDNCRRMISLYGDSLSIIDIVSRAQVPPASDYLKRRPAAKLDTKLEEEHSSSGAWAFWLYAFISQLLWDEDLKKRGTAVDSGAVAEGFVLPPKPWAYLSLGHSGRATISPRAGYTSRGMFSTARFIFVRPKLGDKEKETVSQPEARTETRSADSGLSMRSRKRQRIEDVLNSF